MSSENEIEYTDARETLYGKKKTNPQRLLTLVPINKNNNNNAKDITCMFNVTTKVMSVTIGTSGTISELFRKYLDNTAEKQKSRNYRKQPYWALHTYCVKY